MPSTRDDTRLRTLFTAEQVRSRIDAITGRIARDYRQTEPLLVVVESGARRFAERILAGLDGSVPGVSVTSLRAKRTRGMELRDVVLSEVEPGVFAGRDVLVVDDIIDEGRTLRAVLDHIRGESPRSVRVAVLVRKTATRRESLVPDYVGFEVEDGWILGYGMDLDGRYRELDYLAVYRPDA